MNWDAIGAVGEILGGLAVVATLFYVARQIRDHTRAVERQSHLDRIQNVAGPMLNSPHNLPRIYAKVKAIDGGMEPLTQTLMETYDLDVEESVTWARYQHQVWFGLEADYLFGGPSQQLATMIRTLISFPDSKLFWHHEKNRFSSREFVDYVASLVDDA